MNRTLDWCLWKAANKLLDATQRRHGLDDARLAAYRNELRSARLNNRTVSFAESTGGESQSPALCIEST